MIVCLQLSLLDPDIVGPLHDHYCKGSGSKWHIQYKITFLDMLIAIFCSGMK